MARLVLPFFCLLFFFSIIRPIPSVLANPHVSVLGLKAVIRASPQFTKWALQPRTGIADAWFNRLHSTQSTLPSRTNTLLHMDDNPALADPLLSRLLLAIEFRGAIEASWTSPGRLFSLPFLKNLFTTRQHGLAPTNPRAVMQESYPDAGFFPRGSLEQSIPNGHVFSVQRNDSLVPEIWIQTEKGHFPVALDTRPGGTRLRKEDPFLTEHLVLDSYRPQESGLGAAGNRFFVDRSSSDLVFFADGDKVRVFMRGGVDPIDPAVMWDLAKQRDAYYHISDIVVAPPGGHIVSFAKDSSTPGIHRLVAIMQMDDGFALAKWEVGTLSTGTKPRQIRHLLTSDLGEGSFLLGVRIQDVGERPALAAAADSPRGQLVFVDYVDAAGQPTTRIYDFSDLYAPTHFSMASSF